jgi:hypothetical protein
LFALRREFFCELARRKKWEREAAKSRQEWSFAGGQVNCRFREEFRTLASVRKSPKNEPAVQGMSYGI